MFVQQEQFYSQDLESYATDQNIMLPPLYTKLRAKPHSEPGIDLRIKLPNLETLVMHTCMTDSGNDIREYIKANSDVDMDKYLLACPTGMLQDSDLINRINLRDKTVIVLIPAPEKKPAIAANSSMRNFPVKFKGPNPLAKQHVFQQLPKARSRTRSLIGTFI